MERKQRRKVISLKQLDKISPFKDIESKNSQQSPQNKIVSKNNHKSSHKLSFISNYKSISIGLTEQEQRSINNTPASIKSIEVVSIIATKSISKLDDYFRENDQTLHKVFLSFSNNFKNNIQLIKQQRLETENLNNIVYAHPDKDHYEMHKTRQYSALIQEQIADYESKRTFNNPDYILKPKFDERIEKIRNQISRQSQKLNYQVFQKEFGRIIEDQKRQFETQLYEKKSKVKQNLFNMLQMIDRMKINKQKNQNIILIKNKLKKQRIYSKLFEQEIGLQVMLFRPQNLFFF